MTQESRPESDFYLEWTMPGSDEVVVRLYANHLVFVQAKHYQTMIDAGGTRIPEGVSFVLESKEQVMRLMLLSESSEA